MPTQEKEICSGSQKDWALPGFGFVTNLIHNLFIWLNSPDDDFHTDNKLQCLVPKKISDDNRL